MTIGQGVGPPPRDGIGSSESPGILGLDSFNSGFDIWQRKVHGIDSFAGNAMTRWGNLLEDVVAADFAERNQLELHRVRQDGDIRRQRTLRMKGHPLLTARLDRRTRRAPRRIVEVKTSPYGTGFGDAGELYQGRAGGPLGLPPRIRVQVYHQLAVTGYSEAIVAALIGGWQRRDYVVPRDEQIIEDLVAELEDWWARYVETKTPPPLDGSAGADEWLRTRYPRETADVIVATSEQTILISEWRAARDELKAAEDVERLAKQKLVDAIGDHAGLQFPGGKVTARAQDTTTTKWRLVATAYRTLVEEIAGSLTPGQVADLPSTVRLALDDLEPLTTIYQTTRTDRPVRLDVEEGT